MKSLCFHPTVNKIRKNVVCEYKSLFYLLSHSKSGIFLSPHHNWTSNAHCITVKSSKWCARNSLEIPTRLMRCRHFVQIKQHNIFIFFPEPCHQIIRQTGATRCRCHNNVLFPWCQCDVRDKCPAPLPSFSILHEIKCNAKEWHNTPNTSTVKRFCPVLRHSLIPLIYSIKL